MLSERERERVLVDWNRTAVETPDVSIAQRFQQVAATWPEREAVSFGGRRLTYAELDRRADRLAHRLRSLGTRPDSLVGLCLERSLEMVVALVGIIKAGGAYAPLDPQYPEQRLTLLLEDTGASVVVTTDAHAGKLPAGVRRLCLGGVEEAGFNDGPATALENEAGPRDLAYVLYTSGSTGTPKGVMVEQRSVLRLVCPATYADLGPEQVLLQLGPLAF